MKQVSIIKSVKIKNQRVKPFGGEMDYLATGGLIGNEIRTEKVTYETKPSRADLLVRENQIIVARMKETNKVLLINKDNSSLIVSTGFLVLDVQDGWDPTFLYYFFTSKYFQNQKDRLSIGATQKAINNDKFAKILIPEISLEKQKKFTKFLIEANTLLEKRNQTIKLLDDYLISIFLEIFGDPVLNKKKWDLKPLAKIAKLERGRFSPRPRNDPSYFGGIHPFIQTGDISNSNHRLKIYNQTLNEKGIKVSKQFLKGNIVIAIVGATIGATAILEIDVYATDSIICIKPSPLFVNNIYLEFSLRFWRKILLENAPEAARPNINLSILNDLKITLPPIDLQNKFAEIVEKTESIQQKMLTQAEELENQFQALIQKAFNGQL